MGLKKKLVRLLLIVGTGLIIMLYLAFQLTMKPSQKNQKIIFVEKLKHIIQSALSFEEKNIGLLGANWAEWDNMAQYVCNPSREFENDVFPDVIFNEDMIDMVVVSNLEKEVVFYKGFREGKSIPYQAMIISHEINRLSTLIKRNPRPVNAVIRSTAGPMLVVATPIIAGEKARDARGVLILGRFIGKAMLERISSYTVETIRPLGLKDPGLKAFHRDRMAGKNLFFEDQGDKLTVFYLLRDISGGPAMILFTESDNELFRVLNTHFISLITFIAFTILLLGTLLYLAIEKVIVKRIFNITGTLDRIEGLEDLSNRIDKERGRDEIAILVANINNMLDKLENETKNRQIAERSMITQGKLASIGRLASCIGHEVNNPLLAISNSLQVIKKKNRSRSPMIKEALEISESELDRIRDLISSLLDFHRLEEQVFSIINVREVIQQSLSVLEWSRSLGQAHIIRDIDGDCTVYGSNSRLKQVFINFISNAVEAMENQPGESQLKIKIKPSRDKAWVEVHFVDNGPGIPDNIKVHLFEPFVSTKEDKGVGLGLYISYKIIGNHKGEILYNHEYAGGAHFIIRLPCAQRVKRKEAA